MRAHINLTTKLAAALSMLLPQEERDRARAAELPAEAILRLFQFDHVVLHAHDGSDKWFNLTPMQVQQHREKSRRDTAIVAKVKRIAKLEAEYIAARQILLLHEVKTPVELVRPKYQWPKRKLRSRPLRSR